MKKGLDKLKWVLILLVLHTHAIQAQTTNTKKYNSLLWEITSPQNPTKKSYLYGTMHVSSKLAFNLSDTFFIALNNADIIALESEPTMWLPEVMNLKYATEYFGNYPSYAYTDRGFYQRIFQIVPPQNSEIGSSISSRDIMINSLQYRNDPYMADFEEDTYLDMFIYMAGAKTGRKVVGLENINHTNDLNRIALTERKSRKNDKPMPLWLEERMKEQSINEIFEDAYRQQDLDMMLELQNLFSSEHYIQWFLNERNRLMADSLYQLIKDYSVFTGIGAAHLGGEFGVIEYLRQKGCTVRPVKFLKSDFAADNKKHYDSLKTGLTLTKQMSPDNQFSISLPAPLYELPYNGMHFLCSEMTNGSFFSVNKINTYNVISGLSQELYFDKIDSLLFENIPGKILSKKEIKNGKYKGIEIKNRTKTGDLQHYQIYVTPFEIMIFKMGGRGDFIANWSDSVFSTLEFTDFTHSKESWQRQYYIYGGFSVELPPVHVFDNNSPISAAYNVPTFQGFDSKSNSLFLVTREELMDMYYIEEDNFELERTAEKLAKKHKKELADKKLGRFNGLPSVDFTLLPQKGEKGSPVYCKMILSGGFYYLMVANTHKNKKLANRFFESFQLEPFKNQKPFEKLTDTLLFFSTLTSKDINESEVRIPNKVDGLQDYESYSDIYFYKSETGERIRVYFNKFHQYEYYPDADSLFNETVSDISNDNSLRVFSQKRYQKNGQHILDVYLADTGSAKLIRFVKIIKKEGDAQYLLRTLVDSFKRTSPFIDAFIENFTPIDSVLGASVFVNKGDLFLDDLFSEDSTRFKKAITSLDIINFSRENIDRVVEIIQTYPFKEKKREYLQQLLIDKLAKIKDSRLIDFAKKLYLNHPNNYPIQVSALSVLCSQSSMQAIEALKVIMDKDLPFVMDNDRYVLSPLRLDSIRLWSNMYPQMFEYEHIQEYKNLILLDLSNMLDSGIIDGSFYRTFLPKLIEESQFVLKKYLANEQKAILAKDKKEALDESTTTSAGYNANQSLIQKYKLLLPNIANTEVAELVKSYDTSITSEPNQIQMIRYKLVNKLPVDTALISKIAAQPNYFLTLYKNLDEVNGLSYIPAKYLTDELLSKLSFNVGVSTFFNLEKDTFKMLSYTAESVKGKEYKVFLYEINRYISSGNAKKNYFNPSDYKHYALIAVEVKNGKLTPTGDVFTQRVTIENPEKKDKYLEELLEEFKVRGRERALASDVNEYYSYW